MLISKIDDDFKISVIKSDVEKLAELVLDYYQDCFVNMTTCQKLEVMKELADKVLNNKEGDKNV